MRLPGTRQILAGLSCAVVSVAGCCPGGQRTESYGPPRLTSRFGYLGVPVDGGARQLAAHLAVYW